MVNKAIIANFLEASLAATVLSPIVSLNECIPEPEESVGSIHAL